jgi:hypothetical protein
LLPDRRRVAAGGFISGFAGRPPPGTTQDCRIPIGYAKFMAYGAPFMRLLWKVNFFSSSRKVLAKL